MGISFNHQLKLLVEFFLDMVSEANVIEGHMFVYILSTLFNSSETFTTRLIIGTK